LSASSLLAHLIVIAPFYTSYIWLYILTHRTFVYTCEIFISRIICYEIQIINWGFRINLNFVYIYIYKIFEEIFFSNGEVIILQIWPKVRTKVISMFQFKPLDAISYPFNCDFLDLVLSPHGVVVGYELLVHR